jgi:hypothetical protein
VTWEKHVSETPWKTPGMMDLLWCARAMKIHDFFLEHESNPGIKQKQTQNAKQKTQVE